MFVFILNTVSSVYFRSERSGEEVSVTEKSALSLVFHL